MTRGGHRTFLKWHRARRRLSDPVFTGRRILEGMALGASVEVDLVVTGDGGFAVLHNLDLDRETTGTGAVAAARDADLRTLHLRDNDGAPIADRVMLLDDLCALMAGGTVLPDALLQLDYKQDETVLDAAAVAAFVRATTPVARNLILSSGSAAAVRLLAAAVPGLRIGYDPCSDETIAALRASRDHAGFVRDTLSAAPDAELVYLAWELAIALDDDGFDVIGAFHAANRRVDCWTINRVDAASLAVVERLLARRVDQITTDDPEGLAAALG